MTTKLPIRNAGERPLQLWVEPYQFTEHFADTRPEPRRFDYCIPPQTRWWIAAARELEIQIEIVTYSVEVRGEPMDMAFPSIVVLVHGGVIDVEVTDDAGVVQGHADPPLSHVPPPPDPSR
ncbi:hypothetical protein Dvina_14785 [Dactylosporangium vinaceum]|uniref:Uncharacterized protein n=1 Tax=Dactylosporangium vinaceum TaxID=53362 RepID=A0ABV5M1I9_9ACTN|nr:hypothetical protein [Dactylosporangium vinaceum]UAB99226.1 hypothetical protein Dvina_14785 [Dactylosporangium vinaceum]